MEKKQKKVDAQINEWKLKCDEIQNELDKSQKDAREYSAEVLKLRAENEDMSDSFNVLKKENKSLAGKALFL